jgi:flotillin
MYKAVPPLKDIFDMAGMDLPSYLGNTKKIEEAKNTGNSGTFVVESDTDKK